MLYESASEFKKHMDRGDIVDYSPYLQNPSKYEDHLHSMAAKAKLKVSVIGLKNQRIKKRSRVLGARDILLRNQNM